MAWIVTLPCGPLETNAYLVGAQDGDGAVLIDTPPLCTSIVRKTLKHSKRRLETVFLTHSHFDHIIDLGNFAGTPVMAHENVVAHGSQADLGNTCPPGSIDRFLDDGEMLETAGLAISVLAAPGHDPSSLIFLLREEGIAFVGDVIFQGSVGRTDLPEGNFQTLCQSIRDCVYTLPNDMILYPGHGPPTTVGEEKESNPFVRP